METKMLQPQFPADELYITPFTAERIYEKDGSVTYRPMERNLNPTGVTILDDFIRYVTNGNVLVKNFCTRYGLDTENFSYFVWMLTGVKADVLRHKIALRMADDLLRYTSMATEEVARRCGLGKALNLTRLFRKYYDCTPAERRRALRKKRDEGRFVV